MKLFWGMLTLAMLLSFPAQLQAQSGSNGKGKDKGNSPFFSEDEDEDEDDDDDDDDDHHGHNSAPQLQIEVSDRSQIQVTVSSFSRYKNGAHHAQYYTSTIEIDSDVDFRVILTSTAFTDMQGRVLDPENFGFFIKDKGRNKAGREHQLLGDDHSPSDYALLGTEQEIITSAGSGNAGDSDKNEFEITFELGTQKVRELSGLPRLMDQGIAAGVYQGTLTLRIEAVN